MAGISKRTSGSWVSGDYGIMKTATDTITTLPAVIYPNASTVTVGLKGNTIQNGAPTPQNPVDVNGTGERTGNLFPQNSLTGRSIVVRDAFNEIASFIAFNNGQYVISMNITTEPTTGIFKLCFTYTDDSQDKSSWITKNTPTMTFASNSAKVVKSISITDYNNFTDITLSNIMLNTGSTPQPYEPYGYKIPISSGGTTNNVYLGEVQTERKIKKLVLTGQEEGWIKQDSLTATDAYQNYNLTSNYLRTEYIVTHMPVNSSIADTSTHGYIGQRITLCMNKALSLSTVDLFKIWLADEYSAGHPVILYYVSSTPQTGVVNEPLQKIGTYADSLTTSISCTAGENTLDVQTTVAPSEVTAGFSGWHPVQSVHERENGAWT